MCCGVKLGYFKHAEVVQGQSLFLKYSAFLLTLMNAFTLVRIVVVGCMC